MYAKRLRTYYRMGFFPRTLEAPEKQTANAICDSDTYCPVFEQDMLEV